jgi:tripartite-type tricarboxylate transporter receptor subunit TctC
MRTSGVWCASVALLVAVALAGACAPAPGRGGEAPAAPASKPAAAAPKPAAAASKAAPQAPATSFAGKTVTILVPYTAGGTADVHARQLAMFLGKHIPGNPTVVVQNMPGAGGILGENWVYNAAPRDGTVIGQFVFPSIHTQSMFHPEEVQFELAKLRWLGGVGEPTVTYARPELGIKSGEELPRVTQKIFIGDTSPDSTRGMLARLLLRLLEKDHQFITGYGSSADMRAALRRGELHLTWEGMTAYSQSVKSLAEQGLVVPVAQDGVLQDGQIVRHPLLPDLPTYAEVAVRARGEAVKQRIEYRAMELVASIRAILQGWVYAPTVPDATYATMAGAFESMLADEEFLQGYEKLVGFKPLFLDSAQTQRLAESVAGLLQREPDAIEILRQLSKEASGN